MASYKCKMCGAPLEVENSQTVCTCAFCGSKQTVANSDDERKESLFNRANSLRRDCDFDKALIAYQSILSIFPNEPEAHWGVCLCKYGIEYVDDPVTKKKKPTIHRASFESILKDIDYLNVLAYADVVAKEVYQEEAKEIADIQKNILSISQKEDPFDIFICYKETDESGKRTPDSVLAQEIYDNLVDKGYKVFFSRITLENKLGTMYEPYIFAALNSAKIMLVLGTKKEYFEATWVKNEWSRFLDLMKTRPDHYLIPCYKNMDAYEMPEGFLSFQAQNLARLGFMQDLLRGIDKIMGKNIDAPKVETTNIIQGNININALLKRAEILLLDKDYSSANEKIETVLDNDPTNFKAYLLKLVIDLNLSSIEDLKTCGFDFSNNSNYIKAYKFSDEKEKNKLDGLIGNIKNSNVYKNAMSLKESNRYLEASEEFKKLGDYKDSKEQVNLCLELEHDKPYQKALSFKEEKCYEDAMKLFDELGDYKDSLKQKEECSYLIKKMIYDTGINYKNNKNYSLAKIKFNSILDFDDSSFQIEECNRLEEEDYKESIYQRFKVEVDPNGVITASKYSYITVALKEFSKINGYKDVDELIVLYENKIKEYKEEKEKAKQEALKLRKEHLKKARKIYIISGVSALALTGALLLTFLYIVPEVRQNNIYNALNNLDINNADKLIEENGSYGNAEKLKQFSQAVKYFKSGGYEAGIYYTVRAGGTINVNYDNDGGDGITHNTLKKSKYITSEPSKSGYTFKEWTQESFSVDAKNFNIKLNLKAEYKIKSYTITYNLNNGTNNISNPSTYSIESPTITLKDPSRSGYTFIGWTNGNNEIVTTIPKGSTGNIALYANWSATLQELNVNSNNESLGTVSIISGTGYTDETITISASAIDDNVFKGWYKNNVLISSELNYSFKMPNSSVSITAKFITKAAEEEEEEEERKIAQGITPVFDNDSKTVTYGLYPQAHVSDTTILTELNKLTTTESNGWYLYNDTYYAKLTAKPYSSGYTFDDKTTIVSGTTYWFKCEPIKWKILETSDNTYTLLSTVLLDAHRYDSSSNNYANSEIRDWLNGTFLNSAFNLDSSLIQKTTVDNSASTTNSSSNSYACSNTNDKIYLLSYRDYLKTSYGFTSSTSLTTTRECKTTDYARANGARYNTDSSYLYNGWYWTRSPYSGNSYNASSVHSDGHLNRSSVDYSGNCLRPSLQIKVTE